MGNFLTLCCKCFGCEKEGEIAIAISSDVDTKFICDDHGDGVRQGSRASQPKTEKLQYPHLGVSESGDQPQECC